MDFFFLSFQVFIPVIFKGGASLVAQLVKNPPANAGDARDVGSIPGSGRFPGKRNGNPLQYSFLKNFMDRGAWQAAGHGVAKSRTQLSMHTQVHSGRSAMVSHDFDLRFPDYS